MPAVGRHALALAAVLVSASVWAAAETPAASATVAEAPGQSADNSDCKPAPEAKPPLECPPPRLPKSFAPPIMPFDIPAGDRTAPADIPLPGFHCHWIGPGKRFCHGGID